MTYSKPKYDRKTGSVDLRNLENRRLVLIHRLARSEARITHTYNTMIFRILNHRVALWSNL